MTILDAFRGCLFGGGVGDALGYVVEFLGEYPIFDRFGPDGITSYAPDTASGKALISDDTQMTLFTANGLLVNCTRNAMEQIALPPRFHIEQSYLDWYSTQVNPYFSLRNELQQKKNVSWLWDIPELFHRRAPGNTCMSALHDARITDSVQNYIAHPRNHSKGCGGVMRVAPLAMKQWSSMEELQTEAAQVAAITHGHPLGYMPAAVLCHILNRILFPVTESLCLRDIVAEAKATTEELFRGTPYLTELSRIMDLALSLSENDESDLENIHRLGEGWVAEEALAIALYCSLKYSNDFSKAIIAAVNHKGDSDSTGAIAGNIVGALTGYEALEKKWKKDLECADILLEMAEDLYRVHGLGSEVPLSDESWMRKYRDMCRKA
ncbi:MAG: ADP-ribosylglycohydrolase family protein [Oscillospiraceae bacterium]|nr:ADP-ribosylglycohydrolase family protein [Oscillospiraceae bacterium]